MSISVEAKDLGPIVQLAANTKGGTEEQTNYHLNPYSYIGGGCVVDRPRGIIDITPPEFKEAFRKAWLTTRLLRGGTDTNKSKAVVRRLEVQGERLTLDTVNSDYYTVWGIAQAEATQQIFESHKENAVINRVKGRRRALYQTTVPWAISTHNTLIDPNGRVIMTVRSMEQGFSPGTLSATFEEQANSQDSGPFQTVLRGAEEEMGLIIGQNSTRLLGAAMEKRSAYLALAFVAPIDILAEDLASLWQAKQSNEHTALLAVAERDLGKWLKSPRIGPDMWEPYLLGGKIPTDARLRFHPTSRWRIGLLQEHMSSAR